MRTQVGIVGAGPAGLLLAQLLHQAGIASIVLERHDRAHVEGRIRAGVLEQGTVDLLDEVGVGARMHREGLVHGGIDISVDGCRRRIDLQALTGGKSVMVYGQTEVTKDLIAARLAAGEPLLFKAEVVALESLDGKQPTIRYRMDGVEKTLVCDLVAGCDGFHGACRRGLPESALRVFERAYPFGWLGILTHTRPVSHELIYAWHERGFALFSMRSPSVSRLYIQCRPDEHLEDWPDERIWDELRLRVGPDTAAGLEVGPSVEKGVTPMRSFVVEPMRFGRLFLAGDAAHIVPPTGAKGLNLAMADVRILARGMIDFFRTGATGSLDAYSATALRRVWKAERFSWWMTSLLHRFPGRSPFDDRLQQAELDHLMGSTAAMTALAESYVGLPFD